MQMHSPTKTITKRFAISTLTLLHPLAVAKRLETVFPNVQEIVLVDVALHIAAVNIRASRDGAVYEDGSDGNARTAEIEPVADLALVGTYVSLATELAVDPPLLSGSNDEVHQLTKLFITELQAFIGGRTANRVDGEQAPSLNFMLNKQLLDGLQPAEVHRADACHNVVGRQALFVGNQVDGSKGMVEAALAFTEGIVCVAQPIQTNGNATHACIHQLFVLRLVVGITVADDAPREAVLPQLTPAVGQVRAHQRLAARDNNQNRIALVFGFQRFNRVQEILKRHVLVAR